VNDPGVRRLRAIIYALPWAAEQAKPEVCHCGALELAMRIAVVDDDPIELMLLQELSAGFDDSLDFEGHTSIRAFIASGPQQYDLVFLDRRIPPHNEYLETLPMLASTGYQGRVVLMTAHDSGVRNADYGFELVGPVNKLDLLEPATLKAIIHNA
jgi:CheY-like chemotaxis protein